MIKEPQSPPQPRQDNPGAIRATTHPVESGKGIESLLLPETEVVVIVFRHYQPTPGYPEQDPLVLADAQPQAAAAAKLIAQLYNEGDQVWLAGSGTRARHQHSQALLEKALTRIGISHTSSDLSRPSLRNVRFDLLPGELRTGDVLPAWYHSTELPAGVEGRSAVEKRMQKVVAGLTRATLRMRQQEKTSGKCIVVMFTSGEAILPYLRLQVAKDPALQALLESEPNALLQMNPGEGFLLSTSKDKAQLMYPIVAGKQRVVLEGSSKAVLA